MATAHFLPQTAAVDAYLAHFKTTLQRSLQAAYDGLMALKAAGLPVDAVAPAGAIYLTARLDVLDRTTPEGQVLHTTQAVASYLIQEAKLAVVPFSAFGSTPTEPWFRLSVGGASLASIEAALPRLRAALEKLT